MTETRLWRARAARLSVPFLISAFVALELARPFRAGPVAFDSAVAVLHFDRIIAGRPLETFVSTTPKPLLTFLYGPLFALTHDWRFLTWATIIALAVGVTVLAALARRLDGDRAFVFAAIGLAGAPTLLFDASLALATPWAMLLWAVAAWAVIADRPRYWIAGLALGLATLARLETLVLVGVVLVVLTVVRLGPATIRRPVPRGAWLIGLGLLAVPVAMVHDLLLTGNPLFWTTVATQYSELTSKTILTPAALGLTLAYRYLDEAALVILAVIGWLRLAGRGHWPLAIGLLGLGPGVVVFLLALAARHIFVSDRYFAAIDVSLVYAAAFGLSALSVEIPAAVRHRVPGIRSGSRWLAPIAAGALGVLLTAGWAGLGTGLRTTVRGFRWAAEDALAVRPTLLAAVDAVPGARTWPGEGSPSPARPLLLAPVSLRPQLAVDLDIPLTQIGSFTADSIDLAAGNPSAGQILFHDRHADGTGPGLAQLETDQRTRIGATIVVPLAANKERGYWVLRIDPAP